MAWTCVHSAYDTFGSPTCACLSAPGADLDQRPPLRHFGTTGGSGLPTGRGLGADCVLCHRGGEGLGLGLVIMAPS